MATFFMYCSCILKWVVVVQELVDPSGNILPPIIIMEKGESLNEWSARAEPDLFMSIAVRIPRNFLTPPPAGESLCML